MEIPIETVSEVYLRTHIQDYKSLLLAWEDDADYFEGRKFVEHLSKLRIILDTNQVLPDIWYSNSRNRQTALQDAMQRDEYWAFMAEPVFQEVETKLRTLRRGDVDSQVNVWRTAYVPYIWRVRLKENAYQDDPRIQMPSRFMCTGVEQTNEQRCELRKADLPNRVRSKSASQRANVFSKNRHHLLDNAPGVVIRMICHDEES